jgi:acyl-CoA thioester hydrolase
MTSKRILVQTIQVPVRWGDMDALGHVNNTSYFRYMEEARIAWMDDVLARAGPFTGEGQYIVNASCTFHLPIVYPASVEVRMYLGTTRRSSIESHYDIDIGGRNYAEGAAKIVWVDYETQRSAPLPQRLLSLYL